MPKPDKGRSKEQAYAEAFAQPAKSSPVLSAIQFERQTLGTEKGDGGASMDVNTWQVHTKGSRAYFVGGEPDTKGQKIDTAYTSKEGVTLPHIIKEAMRVRHETGHRPAALIGSWVDKDEKNPEKVVNWDAAANLPSRNKAKQAGKRRSPAEWAVWDNKRGKGVKTRFDEHD